MATAKITCLDLLKNRNYYSIAELEQNIDHLQIKIILHTQKLTADFCAQYILDEYYATCEEDLDLFCIGYVLRHQPHISAEELEIACAKYTPMHHANR